MVSINSTNQTLKIHEAGKTNGLAENIHHVTDAKGEETIPLELVFDHSKNTADIIDSLKEHLEFRYSHEEETQDNSADHLSYLTPDKPKDLLQCFVIVSRGKR